MQRFLLLFLLMCWAGTLQAQPSVINVEIDYMVASDHSHMPAQSEIDAVIQMFACQGITLNVVIDDALSHFDVMRRDPDDENNFFGYDGGMDTFLGIKNASFDNDEGGWHYAIFGHQYQDDDYVTTGSSGLGERPGDDFIVTLGSFSGEIGTDWDRAATFAHELGHNLGLRHAGEMDPGVVGNYVPNVPSIMTYFFQLTGVRTALQCNGLISNDADETLFKNLDYSHGRACNINEAGLSEPFGMGIIAVDWNCDGQIGGTVQQDVGEQADGWCGSDGSLEILDDHNEWNALVDVTKSAAKERPEPEVISCVTAEEMEAFRASMAQRRFGAKSHCTQATPVIEACRSREMQYVQPHDFRFSTGSCSIPFRSLKEASAFAQSGDILYLKPDTYPESDVVITKPLLLLGPGGAEVGEN